MDLKGKNVIYIGGFGGIGQKCVDELLKLSVANLLIFDLNSNEDFLQYLQKTYSNSGVEYIHLDLSKRETIENAFKLAKDKIGHFDVVVNGGGIVNELDADLTVMVNLTGLINSSTIALNYMDKSKGGRGGAIVSISSALALDPSPLAAIYSATKCGIVGFNRAISNPETYTRSGVSFVTICPGFTVTPILNNVPSKITDYSLPFVDLLDCVKAQTAEECAKSFVEVLSKADNGSVWLLDGGEPEEVKFPVLWKIPMKE